MSEKGKEGIKLYASAKVFFGPPDFEDASFYVKEYETKEIEIKLR